MEKSLITAEFLDEDFNLIKYRNSVEKHDFNQKSVSKKVASTSKRGLQQDDLFKFVLKNDLVKTTSTFINRFEYGKSTSKWKGVSTFIN